MTKSSLVRSVPLPMRSSNREKILFYERSADKFDQWINQYDLQKRLRIVFSELLSSEEIKDKWVLDAGCGTGWFSQRATELGAKVVSLDLGPELLRQTSKKCRSHLTAGSVLDLPFGDETFDIVISSEVLEHTVNPSVGFEKLCRALKMGGILVITIPNRRWHFAIRIANALKIRPYEGYENWVTFQEIKKWATRQHIETKKLFGFHIIPFVISWTHPLINYFDRFGKMIGPFMVNIAFRGIKKNVQRTEKR